MTNKCACVMSTLSRLTDGCIRGHVCMHRVGPAGVRCMGRALVARDHIKWHRVLRQMKDWAPHSLHRPDSFPLDGLIGSRFMWP